MIEILTREYLQSLALDPAEVSKRRNDLITKEIEETLHNIKQLSTMRRTKYRVNTNSRLFTPDIIQGILSGLRMHLPDCKITEDVLGNGIAIDWS
jgi:ABC-type taurine transport system ATPase subunit